MSGKRYGEFAQLAAKKLKTDYWSPVSSPVKAWAQLPLKFGLDGVLYIDSVYYIQLSVTRPPNSPMHLIELRKVLNSGKKSDEVVYLKEEEYGYLTSLLPFTSQRKSSFKFGSGPRVLTITYKPGKPIKRPYGDNIVESSPGSVVVRQIIEKKDYNTKTTTDVYRKIRLPLDATAKMKNEYERLELFLMGYHNPQDSSTDEDSTDLSDNEIDDKRDD